MKVLISGISSPLAQSAAKKLLDRGHEVVGFARRVSHLEIEGVKVVSCDLNDIEQLNLLAQDADCIVHAAAYSAPWGKKQDFFKTNVNGTKNIVDAALSGACKCFVHISTPSLYFDYHDRLNITEDFQAKRLANWYVKTKALAEAIVDEAVELNAITLRPRALFGPGDRVLLPRLLKALERGGIPQFRSGDVMMDITYIENAADAIVCAAYASDHCFGQKYNITNKEPVALRDVLALLCHAFNLPVSEKKMSYHLALNVARMLECVAKFTQKEPLITPYSVGVLAFSQTLCIEKAQNELGYEPQVSIEEGIKQFARWWHDQT